jgi:hypothetical protein
VMRYPAYTRAGSALLPACKLPPHR